MKYQVLRNLEPVSYSLPPTHCPKKRILLLIILQFVALVLVYSIISNYDLSTLLHDDNFRFWASSWFRDPRIKHISPDGKPDIAAEYTKREKGLGCFIRGTDLAPDWEDSCFCNRDYYGPDCSIPEVVYKTDLLDNANIQITRVNRTRRVILSVLVEDCSNFEHPVNHSRQQQVQSGNGAVLTNGSDLFEDNNTKGIYINGTHAIVLSGSGGVNKGTQKQNGSSYNFRCIQFLDNLANQIGSLVDLLIIGHLKTNSSYPSFLHYINSTYSNNHEPNNVFKHSSMILLEMSRPNINLLKEAQWNNVVYHISDFRSDDLIIFMNSFEFPTKEVILFLKLHHGYTEPILFQNVPTSFELNTNSNDPANDRTSFCISFEYFSALCEFQFIQYFTSKCQAESGRVKNFERDFWKIGSWTIRNGTFQVGSAPSQPYDVHH